MNKLLSTCFGDADTSGIDLWMSYVRNIDSRTAKYFHADAPFFSGDEDFVYADYLKARTLQDDPQPVDRVFDEFSSLFQGLPNWRHYGTMLNVIPPVHVAAWAAAAYASLFNPNFAQDRYAGRLAVTEMEVVKYMADLLGWEWKQAIGLFTFGGKGTNRYALKVALNRACPGVARSGLRDCDFFFISAVTGHPCYAEVADWAGLGADACLKIGCDARGQMNVGQARETIRRLIQQGRTFLGFMLTGGSTVEFQVDPIKRIQELRDELVSEFGLQYFPHIHVDSVVGWPWLFFNDYDFTSNSLNLDARVIGKLSSMHSKIEQLSEADSVGLDFHKTGFCPYASSLFLVRQRKDLYNIGSGRKQMEVDDLVFGNYSPFEYSLELSRPCIGPVATLVMLKTFGKNGFRKVLAQLVLAATVFREELTAAASVEVLNDRSEGFATTFILKPKPFRKMNLQQLVELSTEDARKVLDYNLHFGLFVRTMCNQGDLPFSLTATDAFSVPGTSAFLGMVKAFPMSIFLDEEKSRKNAQEVLRAQARYDDSGDVAFTDVKDTPIDMVYRPGTK